MAEDVGSMQDKTSNACCAALKKKHSKLLEKYAKVEELKNRFRDCTSLLQDKYDAIENENVNIKKVFEELKAQANMWKDEKEKESGIRIDLEDEVSALKEEVQLLKSNSNLGSQESNEQLQERLSSAEEEIKRLKDLLDKERKKSASEKKNIELEKRKAYEAQDRLRRADEEIKGLKDLLDKERKTTALEKKNSELEERIHNEAQEHVSRADKEIKGLKDLLDKERKKTALEKKNTELEKMKAAEALKKLEMDGNKVAEAQKIANVERKKAEENRLLLEKLKKETDAVKSKLALEKSRSESAYKQVEVEKLNAKREKERADLAVAKADEQRQFAEMNLKKAMSEKERADNLNKKFEEASNRAKRLEVHRCSGNVVEAQADETNTGRNIRIASGMCGELLKNDAAMSECMKNMLVKKDQKNLEKKHSDPEKKVAKEHSKAAKDYKRMAREQKHRANELSRELESCKLRLVESQAELAKSYSYRYTSILSEADTVKKLKNQLKLEKMLVKHSKKASEVEAIRNSMLQQELVQLKQEFLQFQLRFDMLSNSFSGGGEGIHQLEKIGNHISTRETLCSDDHHRQLISGITGLDPPHRGSNQKMSSAINSSSASFSDRPLVGSQEMHTLSVTSAKLGEDISKLKPKSRLSSKTRVRHNEHTIVKADNRSECSLQENDGKRKCASLERERIFDAVKSIEKLYCKGEKLHQQVSEKVSILHDIINGKKSESEEENRKDNPCNDIGRPLKRRKNSSEEAMVAHCVQDNEAKGIFDSDIDCLNACMAVGAMKLDQHTEDGANVIFASAQRTSQFSDVMAGGDYMKLLELNSAADEDAYRRAIAIPLSPLLPDLELLFDETHEANISQCLPNKSSLEEFAGFRDNLELPSIDSENKAIHAPLDGSVSTGMQLVEDSAPACHDDAGSKEANIQCERQLSTPHSGFLKYYVVYPDNKEYHSMSRILKSICGCMPPFSSLDSAEIFVRSILHALLKAHDLSMKEKVCVFFSLLLYGVSEVSAKNWSNFLSYALVQSLDSVSLHICSALTDLVLKREFRESFDLFELLALVEEFLLQRKVFVTGDISSEQEALSSSKMDLVLNGDVVILSEVLASAPLLVAGGSILASLCLAVDHIGCICEISCSIIASQRCGPAVILAILHSFAHICGPKYFDIQQYSLTMSVVEVLVMLLEKKSASANSKSISQPLAGDLSLTWSCCSNCPFSKGAIPIEGVVSKLLENLCKHSPSLKDTFEVMKSVVPRENLHKHRNEDASCFVDCVTSSSPYDENLCEILDTLPLMEILASFMSWRWTADHIIGPICKSFESRLTEGFSAAIIILLGQLGRLGIEAIGYEDPEVEKLREWFSAILLGNSFTTLTLPVQFAILTSLFGLTPMKFEEVIDTKVEASPAVSGQCSILPVTSIRKWFSRLSPEQQSYLRHSLAQPL
ncbi:uncharacterized protein LOC127249817 [Andrographis paniculata]|uniref:uncharacterized protein LOC127249817 n=1 Tax=Andrographis paniculata TaxID=175694 RepID=UPI0021E7125E|nr:uncharacterized protein LOC127249817 [Andrographis paniculata]XP_051128786.1 uncharacterized protein LOC127249817 [Andrographis paniculata]